MNCFEATATVQPTQQYNHNSSQHNGAITAIMQSAQQFNHHNNNVITTRVRLPQLYNHNNKHTKVHLHQCNHHNSAITITVQ